MIYTVGQVLKEEYMIPMNISTTQLADALNVNQGTVSRLINGKSDCSVEMAMRLSYVFDKEYNFWLDIQREVDLSRVRFDKTKLRKIKE
jgi:addiction module HigA family antidote